MQQFLIFVKLEIPERQDVEWIDEEYFPSADLLGYNHVDVLHILSHYPQGHLRGQNQAFFCCFGLVHGRHVERREHRDTGAVNPYTDVQSHRKGNKSVRGSSVGYLNKLLAECAVNEFLILEVDMREVLPHVQDNGYGRVRGE